MSPTVRAPGHTRLVSLYCRKYDPWEAYGQSKLANVMFTYEAVRRLGPGSGVAVNALHPGVVKTELGRCGRGGGCSAGMCRHTGRRNSLRWAGARCNRKGAMSPVGMRVGMHGHGHGQRNKDWRVNAD